MEDRLSPLQVFCCLPIRVPGDSWKRFVPSVLRAAQMPPLSAGGE